MSKQSAPIAYIADKFPSLTQTFVYREVLALRKRGIPIHTYSIMPADPGNVSPEAVPLTKDTFSIFPISLLSFLTVHFRYFFSSPLRYLGTLAFVITQPGESMYNRLRILRHFLYGMLMVREMDRLNIGYVHTHSGWSGSSIALIAHRILGIPFGLTLHGEGIYFRRLLLRAKVQHACLVVTISEYNRRSLIHLFPEIYLEHKIHVIHCGLDPDVFKAAPTFCPNNDKLIIVAVGRLEPCKGFHILIEACRYLKERGIPFRCSILGEGRERDGLERLIDQYNLREEVFLTGRVFQEELRQILSQADVSALPCVRDKSGQVDAIPVSLMETMAMQIPTVSTNISGIPELIKHERNGLLTSPGDAVGLADSLERLKNDPALRQRLGAAGRETVINEFNIYKSAEQIAELFDQMVFSAIR